MNQIDAPGLALLVPILVRAWREKSISARKTASQVFAATVQLLEDDLLLEPYYAQIRPLVQDCALDPTYEVSYEAGKALANLVKFPWCRGALVTWLIQALGSAVEADRSGAGYSLAQ